MPEWDLDWINKETVGAINTFFISVKLNLEKKGNNSAQSAVMPVFYLNLQNLVFYLFHNKKLKLIPFPCIWPGSNGRRHRWCKFPIKTVLKSQFVMTIFEMDQPCRHVESYEGLYDWFFVLGIPIGLWWENVVLRTLPYDTAIKAGSWQAMRMKPAYVYHPWQFLWTKKKVVFIVISLTACSNT